MALVAATANQYRIATEAAGLVRRAERGLLRVAGRDRSGWLHNLVTNVVKTLQPGEGNYAFACNVKGRVLFDLNMLALEDALWLDIDRRWIDAARKHLTKYIITEDVALTDITDDYERLAVLGPAAHEVIGRMGFGNLVPMSQLQHAAFAWEGQTGRMVRHDFAGLPAAELLVTKAATDVLLSALLDAGRPSGLARVERQAVEILRIEAGIPASVSDINEEVVPPETGQIERGISYVKGCYLGQEIIERMRSHGVVARRLVGVRMEGDEAPPVPATLKVGGAEAGTLTSACWSPAAEAVLGLGYCKTAHATPDSEVAIETPAGPREGRIVRLPVRGPLS
jgi:folate-binding protein YgfZ